MTTLFWLTDQERADLIQALKDAQNELCCGPGFPEANGFWERWERLIDRFTYDMKKARQP